jgi:flagellar basal-body rod protein FlgB
VKLFDTTMKKLESALDLRLENQNVLAGNLANVDTPGYLPRALQFDQAMQAATATAEGSASGTAASVSATAGQIPLEAAGGSQSSPQAFVKVADGATGGLDGNGVDLDKTMVELSKNALLYGAVAKATGKKLAILRYVATDGMG